MLKFLRRLFQPVEPPVNSMLDAVHEDDMVPRMALVAQLLGVRPSALHHALRIAGLKAVRK